jgi:serine-type D-Ala-D-Ala carboxypeptidase/endopeptidase (penicillin-binding protein 4)
VLAGCGEAGFDGVVPIKTIPEMRSLRRRISIFTCAWAVGIASVQWTAAAERTAPIPTVASLRSWIQEHVSQSRFAGATWGIKVQSLDTGRVLFEHNAAKRLKPGSNAKLFTAALALDRLGPDYRIRTSVLGSSPPTGSGALRGDLIVRGRGDFSMAAGFYNGEVNAALTPLVDAIERAGIRRVRGDLIGDARWFRGPPFGAGWTWDDLGHAYGAAVSALVLEDNAVNVLLRPAAHVGDTCLLTTSPRTGYLKFVNNARTVAGGGAPWVELHRPVGKNVVHVTGELPLPGSNWVDSVSVHDPALWFVTLLREALDQRGIRVSGRSRSIDWLTGTGEAPEAHELIELAAVESPPMSELVVQMMKSSQNLYAQALWLQAGAVRESVEQQATARGTQPQSRTWTTTADAGLAAMRDFVEAAGIERDDVLLDEGSGLSRRALVTPRAVVELLRYVSRHRHADLFRNSLPVAGVDGTLREQMLGTAAQGNVAAKTGFLAHTYGLSGYVRTLAGERLAFAILLNNHVAESTAEGRADVDAIAVKLAEFEGAFEQLGSLP